MGLGFFTALVGNIWPLVNPWKILFEWADTLARRIGLGGGLELYESYPRRLGVWPALLLYFGFVWVEIIYEGSPEPSNIALLALAYSVITWLGMAWFGRDVWLRYGEAFSVFFGILARFAPTEVRVIDPKVCEECGTGCRARKTDCVNCYECFELAENEQREFNLRPWTVGLLAPERVTLDRLTFIILMLGSVTLDGLLVTSAWIDLETWAFSLSEPVSETAIHALRTLGIIGLPAIFLVLYYGFSALVRALGGASERVGQVAARFVYSLVPIALAYQIAHYYTLLVIQGQSIIPLLSDPFGWGWNVFGTAGYRTNVGLVDAAFAWYSQVAFIVAGHVIAVYLAHLIALQLLRNPKRALRSQYPMLVLMVLYTISSLWILSQPVIEKNRIGDVAQGTSAGTLEVRNENEKETYA
ncbi:MAG: hypothetical protein M3506_06945 [Chloroflexota bacterium]|nr:hypothetical protein [Chloroflexota bacterium]